MSSNERGSATCTGNVLLHADEWLGYDAGEIGHVSSSDGCAELPSSSCLGDQESISDDDDDAGVPGCEAISRSGVDGRRGIVRGAVKAAVDCCASMGAGETGARFWMDTSTPAPSTSSESESATGVLASRRFCASRCERNHDSRLCGVLAGPRPPKM